MPSWPCQKLCLRTAANNGSSLAARLGRLKRCHAAVAALAGLVIAAAASGCGSDSSSVAAEVIFSEYQVTRGNLADVVLASGQVAALESETLTYETVEGRVSQIHFQASQQVHQDDIIVQLDTSDLERDLLEANADLDVARIQLELAQGDATEADILQADADLLQAEAHLAQAEVDLALAESQGLQDLRDAVADAQYALEKAQRQLELTTLTSHASKIREIEYDQAYFERALRDAVSEDEATAAQEALLNTTMELNSERLAREAALARDQDAVTGAEEALASAQAALQRALTGQYDPAAEARLAYERAQLDVEDAREASAQVREGPDPDALEKGETKYDAALATVESIEDAIEDSSMKAPFDGVLYDLYVEIGDLVTASDPVAYVVSPDDLRITAYASEVDVVRLGVGQEVRISFDAKPGRLVPGELVSVSPRGESQGGVSVYEIEAAFDPSDLDISPGMTASLRIVVGEREDVLLVPAAALKSSSQGLYAVEALDSSGNWTERAIDVGISDGIYVEVLDGLSEGDTVRLPLLGTGATLDGWESAIVEPATATPAASGTPDSPNQGSSGTARRSQQAEPATSQDQVTLVPPTTAPTTQAPEAK